MSILFVVSGICVATVLVLPSAFRLMAPRLARRS